MSRLLEKDQQSLALIRPHHFIPDPTTVSDGSFQPNDETRAATQLLYAAG